MYCRGIFREGLFPLDFGWHVAYENPMTDTVITLDAFLEDWAESESKASFVALHELLAGMEGVGFEFLGRPGVSYSLRPRKEGQERPLFALVDVVDDPDGRWLSVCFYADTVEDPEELGDFVPGGLLGQDAMCLDLDAGDTEAEAYIKARLVEAYQKAV